MTIRNNLLELQSLLNSGSKTTVIATQDWNFALTKTVSSGQGVAFPSTRASGGSFFNASGVWSWAPVNYCVQSEFQTGWSTSNATLTVNAASAPNGTTTAAKLVASTSGSWRSVYRSVTTGNLMSVYAKADGKNWVAIINTGATAGAAWFNLAAGTVGTVAAGYTATITNVGGGWYRCAVYAQSGAYSLAQIQATDADNTSTCTVSGTAGVLLWGVQDEVALDTTGNPREYAKTDAATNAAARFDHVYNGTSWESRGLLNEEQRSNTCTYSEDFTNAIWAKTSVTVTGNAIVSPDGTADADAMVETAATSTHILRQDVAGVTAGQIINYSVFIKAGTRSQVYLEFDNSGAFISQGYSVTFNLTDGTVAAQTGPSFIAGSIRSENVGNGWWRLGFAATSPGTGFVRVGIFGVVGGATTYLGVIGSPALYVWGAQVEIGNERTSYIPNLASGSTVRSADLVTLSGSGFTNFWNATEGSFSIEFDSLGTAAQGGSKRLFMFRDAGGTNRLNCELATSTVNFETTPAGANLVAARNTGILIQDRWSGRYKLNDFAASLDGGAVYTDTTVTMPTGIDRLDIGNFNGTQTFNGHIARFRYFNKALTDKQLEDLGKPELSKVLDLQFASNKSLTPLVGPTPSFSRASTKMVVGSTGLLSQVAIDVPAFTHYWNGSQWICDGLDNEDQRINQALYSEQIDNAWWPKYRVTVTANAVVAPDGTTTADKIVEDNTNSYRGVTGYRSGLSVTAGVRYTFSIYLKAAERNWVLLALGDGSRFGDCSANFNLANGTIGTYNQGAASPAMTAAITYAGDGWYRCQINATCLSTSVTSVAVGIQLCSGDNVAVYTGDNVSGVYAWGGQFEAGAEASSYIPTTTGAVTRSADVLLLSGTAFSGIWNPGECTIISEYKRSLPVNAGASPYSIFGSSESTDLIYLAPNGGNETAYNYVGNVVQCGLAAGASPTANQTSKVAFGLRANNFAASKGGATAVTDATGTIPTCTQMKIGYANTNYINKPIRSLTMYSIRLPNRLLQTKSS